MLGIYEEKIILQQHNQCSIYIQNPISWDYIVLATLGRVILATLGLLATLRPEINSVELLIGQKGFTCPRWDVALAHAGRSLASMQYVKKWVKNPPANLFYTIQESNYIS